MTTLPESQYPKAPTPPSAFSAPRPDGSLAEALRRARPWMGWMALAGALVMAGVAAAIAVTLAPSDAQPFRQPPSGEGLKLDKQLSLPPGLRDVAGG